MALSYETILKYFKNGYWTEVMVRNVAKKGIITSTQADAIIASKDAEPVDNVTNEPEETATVVEETPVVETTKKTYSRGW